MTKAKRLTGINPLAYIGVAPEAPLQFTVQPRPPMENDYAEWNIGALWLNAKQKTAGAQEIWMLVRKIGGKAKWIIFGGSGLLTLTGNTGGPVSADGNNNIDFVTNFAPLSMDGNPATFTLTLNSDGTIATSFPTDSGTAIPSMDNLNIFGGSAIDTSASGDTITIDLDGSAALTHNADSGSATASMNVVNVSGGTGISTSGSGNTITISLDDVASSYVTDAGTAVPSAGVLNVLGGLNIETSGSGNTITVQTVTLAEGVLATNTSGEYLSLSKGDDGEILIGTTGGTPTWNNITSTGGTITVTNGPNSINLETGSLGVSVGFSAYKSSTSNNVTGDGTVYYWVANSELFDVGSNYNSSTGIFTAPVSALYLIGYFVTLGTGDIPSIDPPGESGIVTSGGKTYRGDTVDVRVNSDSSVTRTINGRFVIELESGETVKPYATVSLAAKVYDVFGGASPYVSVFYGFKLS